MTAALVLGKFYPPHRGHLLLLREALAVRARVVVLCLGAGTDALTPRQRLDALLQDAAAEGLDPARVEGRAGCDETPFDLEDPRVWRSHLEIFRAFLADAPPVDLLLTSEDYGETLARHLGIGHRLVDRDRRGIPFSATRFRADPVDGWRQLGPGGRRLLATRVVVLGAESTGTTAVATALAERLRARGGAWAEVGLVPEYGRTLTLRKQDVAQAATGVRPLGVDWQPDDFAHVAATQDHLEDAAAAAGGPALVCDTDAFATHVWERRYLGEERARLHPARLGRGHVYLLTHHEGVPFVQDGTRDGEHVREAMTGQFARALARHGRPWAVLTGSLEERVALALRITDQLVARRLRFVPPI